MKVTESEITKMEHNFPIRINLNGLDLLQKHQHILAVTSTYYPVQYGILLFLF
jgi:hypothetical protein